MEFDSGAATSIINDAKLFIESYKKISNVAGMMKKTLNCKGSGLASILLKTVNENIVNVVVEASFVPDAVLNFLSLKQLEDLGVELDTRSKILTIDKE